MRVAFSTVACPEWTLPRVAKEAETCGFQGVELRTFGTAGNEFACEPFLTDPAKIRDMMEDAGAAVVCLATGIRFDAPIGPPIIGRVISDTEQSVRECKHAVELAAQLECPFVRVFAFETQGSERRDACLARIMERLKKALDAADKTGVRLLMENGGSFCRAADLIEIMDMAGSTLLAAAYNVAVAARAGEDPVRGIASLGSRLGSVKLKDFSASTPCHLGEGELPNEQVVAALARNGFNGPIVYEYDRAWLRDLPEPSPYLAGASRRIFGWIGAARSSTAPVAVSA